MRYPPRDVRTRLASSIKTEKQLRASLAAGTFEYDCSQTVEIVCVCAGLDWPEQMRNGATSSMLATLPHYTKPKTAELGALCVLGPGAGEHVCQVRHPGVNPILFSHGSDRSAIMISLSAERVYHKPPVTFLSIVSL